MDEDAVRRVVRVTIQETFTALGMNMTTPEAIINAQHDFAFVRRARVAVSFVRKTAITAVFMTTASGIGAWIWNAVHATAPR